MICFALLPIDPTQIAQYVVNGLAVGGGFLVGYYLSGVLFFLIDKWLTRGKTPAGVHWFVKRLGGVLVALIVALIVFGSGAGGFGLGRGPGDGDSPGTGKGDGTLPTSTPTTGPSKPPELPISTEPAPPEQRFRVLLLSGDQVLDEKFYVVESETQPKTFPELVASINAKHESTGKPVAIEIRFTAVNPLSLGHGAVSRLVNWAKANRHTVTFPASKP